MRLDAAAPRRRAAIGLTALIDVVFILLLFFLLASQFQRYGALPISTPVLAAGPAAPDAAVVTLRLRADGSLLLDGAPVAMADLGPALAAVRARRGALPVAVTADPDATLQPLVTLLDALAAAGVSAPLLR